MENTIPCPGCGTELNLADVGCPVCLRGRSKQEIMRGYSQAREREQRRRRRPFTIIVALLASGAAGWLLYMSWPSVLRGGKSAQGKFDRFYDQITDPNYYRGGAGKAVEPPPQPVPVQAGPAAAPRAPSKPAPPARRTPGKPIALPALQPNQWALSGRAYDLLTLAPAPGVQFTAKTENGGGPSFRSNEDGYYLIILYRDVPGGYHIETSDERYAAAVQYEGDIPYARLPARERRELAHSALEGDSRPSPLADIVGEPGLRRDLFVTPRR